MTSGLRPEPLTVTACRVVPFATAARWASLGAAERERGTKVTCPSCGERAALKLYPDHGYCFAEQRRFSAVTLLAEHWEMDPDSAAARMLEQAGYAPGDWQRQWDEVPDVPGPARDDLAAALRTWCEGNCPDWAARQYEAPVAARLSRCLGVLARVQTAEECSRWLAVAKEAMRRSLSLP